jgi:polyisoprenoid-binding protein YceI
MSGKVVVDPGSGDSGEGSRDKKMKNDVLQAQSFSSITFEPTSFLGQLAASGTSQIQVKGNFTVIGKPHEIVVPMTVQMDGSHCTATGSFIVPYVQWGLKDPSIFVLKVGNQVKIDLSLVGQVRAGS